MHPTHWLIPTQISATSNNGRGIAGVAGGDGRPNSGVKLMISKIFDNDGRATVSAGARAIQYGAENGARVSANSWSSRIQSVALQDAIEYFGDFGGIVVAGAGNENSNVSRYPSCAAGVVSVANVYNDGRRYDDSSYGPCIDVAAPGVRVLSTVLDDDYLPTLQDRRSSRSGRVRI